MSGIPNIIVYYVNFYSNFFAKTKFAYKTGIFIFEGQLFSTFLYLTTLFSTILYQIAE